MSIATYIVTNDLPAPTSSSTTQTFTDVYGEQWVAKSGVYSGAWRKARDVLHAVVYRNATLAMPNSAGTVIAYDTPQRDVYGMYVVASKGYVIQATGYYRMQASCNSTATATGQYIQGSLFGGPTGATVLSSTNNVTITSGGLSWRTWAEWYCTLNDLIQCQAYVSVASQNVQLGLVNARLELSYIGTG